jgi:hypothetical protein
MNPLYLVGMASEHFWFPSPGFALNAFILGVSDFGDLGNQCATHPSRICYIECLRNNVRTQDSHTIDVRIPGKAEPFARYLKSNRFRTHRKFSSNAFPKLTRFVCDNC